MATHTGGVLTALALLCLANANASVRMYVLWMPDQGSSVWQRADSGATIGGVLQVRVVVQPNGGYLYGGAYVVENSITELADHHYGQTHMGNLVSVPPNPAYGDPTSNVAVLQSDYLFLPHSATYRLRVRVRYVVIPPFPPQNTVEEEGEMLITLRHLQIVDSRAEPYFVLNPAESQPEAVPFSAHLQGAQRGTCTVRLEIFSSSDNQNPVLVREFANVSRPGNWSWTWDGRLDDGSIAPRGVYTYRLSANTGWLPWADGDSTISPYLRIERAYDANNQPILEAEYWGYDDRGTPDNDADDEHLYFIRWYALRSDRNASSGQVWLFDPELQRIGSWELSQSPCVEHNNQPDGLTASTAGIRHGVLVRVPVNMMSEMGEYLFVVHAVDDHADVDKCHRRRPALPLNAQIRVQVDKVRLYYRNLSNRERAYPFSTDQIALRAIVWATTRNGTYAFCGMRFDVDNNGNWFDNDGYWFATGTNDHQDTGCLPLPRLPASERVYRWPGAALQFSWYRLRHEVDFEASLSVQQTNLECYCNGAEHVHRYYYYPPFTQLDISGWGTNNLSIEFGTWRYAVRVIWWVNGQKYVKSSPAPTPGAHQSPNPSPVNWNLTWSQNCDEAGEYAVRISVRDAAIDIAWQPNTLRRSYLQWLSSCINVPYEWGGRWYGGKADIEGDKSGYDHGYGRYGFDCVGVVNAAAKRAGYNWPAEPYTVTALVSETYSYPIPWQQREPGDILAKAGSHVVTIHKVQGTDQNPTDSVVDAHGAPGEENASQEDYHRTHICPKRADYWKLRGFQPYRLKDYPE